MLGDIDGPEKAYRIMDSYFTVKMLQHVLQTDGQTDRENELSQDSVGPLET